MTSRAPHTARMQLEEEAARRVGTTLCHKWTLDRLIGTGGMAAVYVATHRIGRREAIKILHREVAQDPEFRARFEQEAHAVNRFKHPGAVEIRDIDVAEDGAPFLVMELLEGETLSTLARRDATPLPDVLRWADELLDVLAAAHAQGIIHRDIKPENLFIQTDGHLKVLDFGIARVRASAFLTKPQTRAGEALGTATYMPPEQIHGTEIDARADLFAVGATLFRLLTKRRVHEATNEADLLVKMGSLPAPRLCDVAPELPRDVGLVVDRALMFHREDRYPDARTMQLDVRAVRESKPPPYAASRPQVAAPQAVLTANGSPPASLPTRAASPGAIAKPSASAPAGDSDAPPETVDAQRVGAALLDVAPVRGRSGSGRGIPQTFPGEESARAPLPPPVAPNASAPLVSLAPASEGMTDSTMRSVVGPEAQGGHASAQGYSVPVEVLHPTPRVTERPGPSTQVSGQVSGMEAVHPVSAGPGESIRVVEAPPVPKRHLTLPGTDVSVWPLLLVGVVFASIGVGVTLFFMLKDAPPPDAPPAHVQHPQVHPAPAHAPTVHR